jgi:hypothetical protein
LASGAAGRYAVGEVVDDGRGDAGQTLKQPWEKKKHKQTNGTSNWNANSNQHIHPQNSNQHT